MPPPIGGQYSIIGRALSAGLPVLVWLIPLAVSFYTTPGIVRAFGATNYGDYTLALGIAVFAAIPSANSAIARFSKVLPGGKQITAPFPVIAATLTAFIIANVLLVGLPVVLTNAAHWSFGPAAVGLLLGALTLLMTGTSFSQLLMVRLQMRHRWHLGAGVIMAAGCCTSLAGLAAARSGVAWEMTIAIQSLMSIAGLAILLALDRYLGRLPDRPESEAPGFGSVFAFMTSTAASGLIGALLIVGERIFLSARFGSANSGYYALAMSIALLLHAVVNSASVRLPLHFSRARSSAGSERFRLAYEQVVRLTVCATCGGLAFLLARGDSLCRLWLGAEVGAQAGAFLPYLAAAMGAFAMIVPTWTALEVAGHERRNVALMMIIAACLCLGAALFADVVGPLSVAYGRLVGVPVIAAYVILGERVLFGRPLIASWLSALARSLVAALPVLLLDAVMPDKTMVHLVAFAIASAFAYLALGAALGLWRTSDLNSLADRI